MYRLLLITILIILSCTAEKTTEVGGQKPSEEERGTTSAPAAKGKGIISTPLEQQIPGTKRQVIGELKAEKAAGEAKEKLNTPPEIKTIRVIPERFFKPEDRLGVEVTAGDADGDEVTVLYEWTKNGKPAGNDKWIEDSLKRGDKISVMITPFDGKDYGHSRLLEREILNFPPLITEGRDFRFDGNVYQQQVKASDPDGDVLTFSLKEAPKGMKIDEKTGLITWTVDKEAGGKFPVQVSVTDGHGGEGTYNFDVIMGTEGR